MLFKNDTGKGVKVKIKTSIAHQPVWQTVLPGEVVELPEVVGLANGFSHVPDPLPEEKEEIVIDDHKKKGEEQKEEKEEVVGVGSSASEEEKTEEKNDKDYPDLKLTLMSIKGVGEKTALDLMNIWPNIEALQKDIENEEHLPCRDDIAKILKEVYGNKK